MLQLLCLKNNKGFLSIVCLQEKENRKPSEWLCVIQTKRKVAQLEIIPRFSKQTKRARTVSDRAL